MKNFELIPTLTPFRAKVTIRFVTSKPQNFEPVRLRFLTSYGAWAAARLS